MITDGEGSGKAALMRRLARSITARLNDPYGLHMNYFNVFDVNTDQVYL